LSDVLVVGAGPLPGEETDITCSYNLRTAKLASWLAAEGVRAHVAAVDLFSSRGDRSVETRGSFTGDYTLMPNTGQADHLLGTMIQDVRPRCLLAVSYQAADLVCRLDHRLPVWADLPGWIMAEAQLTAARLGSDAGVASFGGHERVVLKRADKVSVVSHNQRLATLGELATLGRLNRRNQGYELVHRLPSLGFDWSPLVKLDPDADGSDPAEPLGIGPDAPVFLWSGTYNVWTDIGRIFALTESLLRQVPGAHYVSTGGVIPGYNEDLFGRFSALVAGSGFRSRYHLLPWVGFREVLQWFRRASLGLCIDGVNLEVVFGSRTRLVDMLSHGLAAAATPGTELASDLAANNAIIGLDPREPDGWADAILSHGRTREAFRGVAERGRRFIYEHYGLPAVGTELLAWLRSPEPAPDNAFLNSVLIDGLKPGAPVPRKTNAFWNSHPLVTWQPQQQIEKAAKRILDPYPPSRRSRQVQNLLRRLLNNRVTAIPMLGAWGAAARLLPPRSAARWQSRIGEWVASQMVSVPTAGEGAGKAVTVPNAIRIGVLSGLKGRKVIAQGNALGARAPLSPSSVRAAEAPNVSRKLADLTGRFVYSRAARAAGELCEVKAVNVLLARCEYDRTAQLSCRPQRVEIEPSSACNIRCHMCGRNGMKMPPLQMTPDVFYKIVPYLRTAALLEIVGAGEPTLNPHLGQFIEVASRLDCYVRLFTNATVLSPSLCAELVRSQVGTVVFSLPGFGRQTYERVTGSDRFEEVVENMRTLRDVKQIFSSRFPRLRMNCALTSSALETAADAVRLAADLGCEDVSFGIACIFDPELEQESLLKADPGTVARVFDRCRELGRELSVRVDVPDYPAGRCSMDTPAAGAGKESEVGSSPRENRFGCLLPWQSLLVRANGSVEACVYNRKIVGDLNEQGIEEIWNGAEFRRFREGTVTHNGVNYCARCYHLAGHRGAVDVETHFAFDATRDGY
jgi:MoaA/NifB/PqqE/SkfB family radical SAM enzyme